jgi:tetratricopeptide (TPR) repeat protein
VNGGATINPNLMKTSKRLLLSFAFFAVVSLSSFKTTIATIWLNIGYIHLNHTFAGDINRSDLAQKSLSQAANWIHDNERANWALGQALLTNDLEKATNIWRDNMLAASRLINYAELAEKEQDWAKAQTHYYILRQLEGQNSDHWYNHGRMAHRLREWETALESYKQAINLDAFNASRPSNAYYQLGVIYQSGSPEVKDLALALQNYEQALHLDQFSDPAIKAESWYKIGEIYSWQGRKPDILVNAFSKALAINPQHNWARLRYGYSLYWLTGEIAPSEAEIQQVISSWEKSGNPSLKWGYRYLADIYADQEDWEKAKNLYLRVLEIDPSDQYSQDRLARLDQR